MTANDAPTGDSEPSGGSPTDRQVAANLQRLRTKRGLSTTRLSAALSKLGQPIPATGITRIEKEQRRVNSGELIGLAVALQVSPLTLLLPWPENADAEVEITAIGTMSAEQAWDWAMGFQPPALSDADPVGDLQRFPLDSLPPWARPLLSTVSVNATEEQWKKLAEAGYLREG